MRRARRRGLTLTGYIAWHLRNIAHRFRLLDGRRADLESTSKQALVAGIVAAVMASESVAENEPAGA